MSQAVAASLSRPLYSVLMLRGPLREGAERDACIWREDCGLVQALRLSGDILRSSASALWRYPPLALRLILS